MLRIHFLIGIAALSAACVHAQDRGDEKERKYDVKLVEQGRYLVKIAGCNDCHTAGYVRSSGKIPERDWLKGSPLGWRGPWGTTYAGNLRLFVSKVSEDEWLAIARHQQFRPPMPWFNLRQMTDRDLRAIHRFVTLLGPAGDAMPKFVPPEHEPEGPVVQFPEPRER